MFIKSIDIEGFKSYGTRTLISGFDPLFNAITGLNGSGKSNILDSICFVLGITNLKQVRAENLEELVYKNGQAGIHKASVTINFDNSDSFSSPQGYADRKEISVTRIVVIGGKNKYIVNGKTVTNNTVQDLFQSVQLNVNNPHFLIMQGRITKVLNMKPLEILSMVEESAGTRMYESKREDCLRLIAKKDSKLKEINMMLTEHIAPRLLKLKEDRKEYSEYTKVIRELEILTRLYIAWQFVKAQETNAKAQEEKESIDKQITDIKESIAEHTARIKDVDSKIGEIEAKMDKEGGGNIQVLEQDLKGMQLKESKIATQISNLKQSVKQEAKKKDELIKNHQDDKTSLVQKEKDVVKAESKLNELKAICDKDNELLQAAQNHYQALAEGSAGDGDGENASLGEQITTMRSLISTCETEAKRAEMARKCLTEDIQKTKAELQNANQSMSQSEKKHLLVEKEVQSIKEEICKLNYEEGKYDRLVAERNALLKNIDNLNEQIDSVYSKYPRLRFDYKQPSSNFKRDKVYGPVCTLFQLKDPKTAVALDFTAGGKLYNVVLEDEVTGKELLNRGQLKQRHTFIPLNKVVGRIMDNRVIQEAENLVGRGNVFSALSLVNYAPQLKPAMEYVFGDTLVCTSIEHAKRVAFAPSVRKRTVTLEGEVIEPAGTLSGGSMGQRGKLLSDVSQMTEMKKLLSQKEQLLHKVTKEAQNYKKVEERYQSLQYDLDLKEKEVGLLKSNIETSARHKKKEELKKLENSLEEQKAILVKCKADKTKTEKELKVLEAKMVDPTSTRDKQFAEAKKCIAAKKKQYEVSCSKFKDFQEEMRCLELEIETLKESFPDQEEQIKKSSENLAKCESDLEELEVSLKEIKESISSMSQEIKVQKDVLKVHNQDIGKLHKQKNAMSQKIDAASLQLQQLEHDVVSTKESAAEAYKKINSLVGKYPWIEEQKKLFGIPNTEFDFQANDPVQAGKRLGKLEDQKAKLEKTVNMRAQNMLTTVEEQHKDLVKKRQIVLNDKDQIQGVIMDLDGKKKIALKHACEQVNNDFGSIFRTLLPGSNAKLVAQDGTNVLNGLEFKVAFGEVWKEALTELSGGQRSLVALSLILALLLFNPAPIYILDEVDAALDISHTQNIGTMLKRHFQKSQFIVVSLKDGMFSNANVLFRTKFTDGMSSVSRTSQK